MYTSTNTIISNSDVDLKLYSYRWIIIILFGLYSGIIYFQFMQFTIIENIVVGYYGVDGLLADMSGLVFMVFYILLFIPAGYIVENNSLKTTSVICSGLLALGNCLKLFAVSPDRYYLVLLSQSICAITQTIMVIIPTKIACTWFGAEEVSTACSIGLFGTQIGLALGAILPTVMVENSDNKDIVGKDLNTFLICNAIASVVIWLLVIIFFRSKPPSPPSESQVELISKTDDEKMTYWMALKGFARNKDFLIVVFTLGTAFGLWNSYGLLINQLFEYSFPDESNSFIGFLLSAAIIAGGCFGTVIFGYLLDKTHQFKWIALFALGANTIVFIIQAIFMLSSNKIGICIITPIYGFFSGSLMVICYEYATETTYPTPEAFGASILNVHINFVGLFVTIIIRFLFENIGNSAGYIAMVIFLALGAFPMLFISTDLKRLKANHKSQS